MLTDSSDTSSFFEGEVQSYQKFSSFLTLAMRQFSKQIIGTYYSARKVKLLQNCKKATSLSRDFSFE